MLSATIDKSMANNGTEKLSENILNKNTTTMLRKANRTDWFWFLTRDNIIATMLMVKRLLWIRRRPSE